MLSRRVLVLGLVGCVALLAGCSDQYEGRKEVRGRVVLEGQPLKDGTIAFLPQDGGNLSGSPIVNGEYKLPRKDGLKPGKYLVQITSGDGVTPANESEAGAPGGSRNIVSVDRIPAEWNVKPTHDVTVTANGENRFDFDIPRANTPAKGR